MNEGSITADLCGLYIVDTGLVDSEFDGSVFQLWAGTGLAFLAKSSDRLIVKLKPDESTIESFSDDQGGDLLKNAAGQPAAIRFDYTQPTADNKTFVMQVSTRSTPTSGATQLTLQARFALVLAKGTEASEITNVPLTPGPLALDGLDIEIVRVGPPEFNLADGVTLAVQIATRGRAVDVVESLELLDSEGSPLSTMGISLPEADGKLVSEYGLLKEVASATIRFVLWSEAILQHIPIAAEVRLGFGVVKP